MKRLIISIAILFCISISYSQVIIEVKNCSVNKGILSYLEGEKYFFLDSISLSKKDQFQFNLKNSHPGFYRFTLTNNKSIDFVFDNERIEIKTDENNISDSLHIIKSESNKIYYSFLKLNNEFRAKIKQLSLMFNHRPKDDNNYKITLKKFTLVQEKYSHFINVTAQAKPNSFIAKYIKSAQLPAINYNLPFSERINLLRAHALDSVDFSNDDLTYSDLFTSKAIEYVRYYRDPRSTMKQLEIKFTIPIDTLLNKAKVNFFVHKQIVESLIDHFKEISFNEDIKYIYKNYVEKDDLCLNNDTENSIKDIINQMKLESRNSSVPNIIMKDSSGNEINMEMINSDKLLILFYTSLCPHCQKLIPKLITYLNNDKENDVKVVAISLDDSRTDWINFIRNNDMKWINVHSNNGWDCKAAKDYHVRATPTMFLLNNTKKIICKPRTIDELNVCLKKDEHT